MAWFTSSRRGPEWKYGWREQTLSSLSPPPFPLMAFFAILLLLLSLSYYFNYKEQMRHTVLGFQFLLLLIPVLLVWLVRSLSANGGRLAIHLPKPEHEAIHRAGSSPWGVGVVVVLLLVMISYQSSFHSQWFRPLWRSD